MSVRVRFAPSPTGPLHIGGVRTALFNYLFAKRNGGTFILRIEDTDQTRFVPGAEAYIIESLKWLGISPTEGQTLGGEYGPYRQSERKAIYWPYAQQLVNSGHAYYAFDTADSLDKLRADAEVQKQTFIYNATSRMNLVNSLTLSGDEVQAKLQAQMPFVIRFKMPDNEAIEMNDLIRGKVVFNSKELDDKVLFKSDGLPTYHLANVVDDYLMKITHVIRGEEWLPSLPLHVLLYKAFGWAEVQPLFSHLPLILKPTGNGKLSKRDGDKMGFPVFPLLWTNEQGETSRGYREDGYIPEAVVNMLALLGWNPGIEQEIFTLDQLAEHFDLNRVGKSGSKFDPDKAKWFNQQYLRMMPDAELAQIFSNELKSKGIDAPFEKVLNITTLIKERVQFSHELWSQSFFLFEAPAKFEEKVVAKHWKPEISGLMQELSALLNAIDVFEREPIHHAISEWLNTQGIGMGKVMNPLRLAITGDALGPDLISMLVVLGKQETLNRIQFAVQNIGI